MKVEIVFPHFDNHSYLEVSDKETGEDVLSTFYEKDEEKGDQLNDISSEFIKECEKLSQEFGKKLAAKMKEFNVIPQDAEVETYPSLER